MALFRCSSSSILDYVIDSVAEPFSDKNSYVVGDYVIYNDLLYKCTTNHSGAWNSSHWTRTYLSEVNDSLDDIEPTQTGISKNSDSLSGRTLQVTNVASIIPSLFNRITTSEIYIRASMTAGWHTQSGGGDLNHSGNFSNPQGVTYDQTNGTVSINMSGMYFGDGEYADSSGATAYFIPGGPKDISSQFK